MNIAFFGNPPSTTIVLNTLKEGGHTPNLIVSAPDKPVGRKQVLTPPASKVWAEENNITTIQPTGLKTLPKELTTQEWDLFIVFAYGHIIPASLLSIPRYGTLNIHPSLLPFLRGPSPIQSAILNDMSETGVTVMLMDEMMDHGPIIAQDMLTISEGKWPLSAPELETELITLGSSLLVDILPEWTNGSIETQEQDHQHATFTQKISKSDGEIILDPYHLPKGKEAYANLLKIRAFTGWPETYFYYQGKRIKIKDAVIKNNTLYPTTIMPEGKSAVDFEKYFLNHLSDQTEATL